MVQGLGRGSPFFSFLAACGLFSTWCKAQGYGVSGRLPGGLDSKERGSLNSHFGVCCFDIKEPTVSARLVYGVR